VRLILAYKNFAAAKHVSHIGLGVSALNTCKRLQDEGIECNVWPVLDGNNLRQRLHLDQGNPITHVVISAPWIPTDGINQLSTLFPNTQFAVNCHSNVGFLQADTNGVRLLREYLGLEMAVPNFNVSANSSRMSRWVTDAYGSPCQTLPNLYYLDSVDRIGKPLWNGSVLRIGIFGATRPQKNFMSAVGAAVELSYQLKAQTEIWINTGRLEGGGNTILNSARELVRNLPLVTLREAGWMTWPEFRRLIGTMHLLLQPSYTESFNMVTADGIAEGVPSVVSDAIDWVPHYWQAYADDVFDIARVARHLLFDSLAAREGIICIRRHNEHGIRLWKEWLK
jgi:glycosyltransferase involved in cell wall biosynthesis